MALETIRMTSPKLLLSMMVVATSLAAPQINERQVVGDVLAQLQPAISRAIGSINVGGSSSFGRAGSSSGFRGGAQSFGAGSSGGFSSAPVIQRFTPSQSSRGFSSGGSFSGSAGGSNPSSITATVVSQLQPSIAAAVAQALRASQRPSVGLGGSRGGQDEYADGPASYQYGYKVADDEAQTYMAHEETRDGDQVQGKYNYVDATGALVTVNYQARPETGYTEQREVQKNAVQMRNIPGAWTGPLAGVDDVQGAGGAGQSSGLSQSDLIARILAQIQPQITGAVQSAIGANRGSSGGFSSRGFSQRPASVGFTSQPATIIRTPVASTRSGGFGGFSGNSGNSGLVSSIVSSLQPRISSAVNSAISSRGSSRRGSSSRGGQQQVSGGGNSLGGLFGTPGQTSVSLQTPEFSVQY